MTWTCALVSVVSRALIAVMTGVSAGVVASRMSAGVREEAAGAMGGMRSEGRDMLGIVGRAEGKTPGILGIGAIPGRLRGGRGGRDGKPARKQSVTPVQGPDRYSHTARLFLN